VCQYVHLLPNNTTGEMSNQSTNRKRGNKFHETNKQYRDRFLQNTTCYIMQNADTVTAGWMDGWLGFNGILSTQVAAISCLRKFKVC